MPAHDADTKRIRDALDKYGAITAEEIGLMLGGSPSTATKLARQAHREGLLIAVWAEEGLRYPYFQIRNGEPHRVIATMRETAANRGWNEHDLFLWLVRPSRHLPDRATPADLLGDPDRQDDLLHALDIELHTERRTPSQPASNRP